MALWKFILFAILCMAATCYGCDTAGIQVRQTPSVPAADLGSEMQDIVDGINEEAGEFFECELSSTQTLPDGDNFTAIMTFCCDIIIPDFSTTEEPLTTNWA